MRSALAGIANNVVAVKTTAAVPKSVIERNDAGHPEFLETMNHLFC
jgi:hypothetical protein